MVFDASQSCVPVGQLLIQLFDFCSLCRSIEDFPSMFEIFLTLLKLEEAILDSGQVHCCFQRRTRTRGGGGGFWWCPRPPGNVNSNFLLTMRGGPLSDDSVHVALIFLVRVHGWVIMKKNGKTKTKK
jgi:hypothetical protein